MRRVVAVGGGGGGDGDHARSRRRDDRPDGPQIRSGVAGSRLNVAPDTTLPVDIGSVLWATLVPHSRARKTIASATFWRQWAFRISA